MVIPEEKEQEDEDFEPVEEEKDEFEPVEEEDEPGPVEEFEGFDDDAADDIASSGFKTKGGEIPDYEPTVDEVLSYAMGKTRDPSQPGPTTMDVEMDPADDLPEGIEEALDELMEDLDPKEVVDEDGGGEEPGAEPVEDEPGPELEGLDEAFADEEGSEEEPEEEPERE